MVFNLRNLILKFGQLICWLFLLANCGAQNPIQAEPGEIDKPIFANSPRVTPTPTPTLSTNSNVNSPSQAASTTSTTLVPVSHCGSMNPTECQVLDLVNVERSNHGLPTLTGLSKCVTAAQYHANDMAQNNYFAHDGLSETWWQRMQNFALSGSLAGENIAKGQTSASSVMTSWMNSSGHRANILSSSFRSMGVGLATDVSGTLLWVQCFSGYAGDF